MTEDARLEGQLRYWRSRAEALDDEVGRLRRRLLALPQVVPAESLPFLEEDAEAVSAGASSWGVLRGWEDTIDVFPSDLEEELTKLWDRLGGGSVGSGPTGRGEVG